MRWTMKCRMKAVMHLIWYVTHVCVQQLSMFNSTRTSLFALWPLVWGRGHWEGEAGWPWKRYCVSLHGASPEQTHKFLTCSRGLVGRETRQIQRAVWHHVLQVSSHVRQLHVQLHWQRVLRVVLSHAAPADGREVEGLYRCRVFLGLFEHGHLVTQSLFRSTECCAELRGLKFGKVVVVALEWREGAGAALLGVIVGEASFQRKLFEYVVFVRALLRPLLCGGFPLNTRAALAFRLSTRAAKCHEVCKVILRCWGSSSCGWSLSGVRRGAKEGKIPKLICPSSRRFYSTWQEDKRGGHRHRRECAGFCLSGGRNRGRYRREKVQVSHIERIFGLRKRHCWLLLGKLL